MKAKDYFNRIESADDRLREFAKCIYDMVTEVSDIQKSRNAKNDEALRAIFKEQELKYYALVRLINSANFDFTALDSGFREFIKNKTPILYNAVWKPQNLRP